MTTWLTIRCYDGEAGGYTYRTLVEPPDEIAMCPNPERREWLRVLPEANWPGAVVYTRKRQYETSTDEWIYCARTDALSDDSRRSR